MVKMIDDAASISKGGIIIPEMAQECSQLGKVIAVGPGRMRPDGSLVPRDIRVGDTVLLGKYSGSKVKLDGVDYMILDGDEALGVIRG
jgi:chaperonin GroES